MVPRYFANCSVAVFFACCVLSCANDFAGELVVTDRVGAAQEPTFQYREGPARLDGDVPWHCESSQSPKQRCESV